MVIFFERVDHGHKVQALEAGDLDDIVLQAPMLSLEWDDVVDIFEQTRNRVRLRAVAIGHAPEDVGGREAVPLHC